MNGCCQVRCLSHAVNHTSHVTYRNDSWDLEMCFGGGQNYVELKVNILVHLQKSFVYYQVSGGEVK